MALLTTFSPRRSPILVGVRQASFFNRASAKTIDLLLVIAIYFTVAKFWGGLAPWVAAVYALVQDAFGQGQSVGKRITGLRVIEDQSGMECSLAHSIIRNCPLGIAIACSGIPVVWFVALIFCLPLLLLEIYLVHELETGVRLGDVMSNTLVVESLEDHLGTVQNERFYQP